MGKKKVFVTALVMLAFLAAVLPGQSMSGGILGNVRNEEGVPLAGVMVTVINVASNATSAKSTGEDGAFRMLGLASGVYQVSFEKRGYETYTAAGVRLSVEQKVTLRIKLKKVAEDSDSVSSFLTSPDPEESGEKISFFKERRKLSFHFTIGMDFMAVGDSNRYLSAFPQRVLWVRDRFETLHSGGDLNAEIGYRITPRLELAVGLGWVHSQKKNNDLTSWPDLPPNSPHQTYLIDLNVQSIPLALICRYWLAASGHFIFSVHGAAQYHFATWKMHTWQIQSLNPVISMNSSIKEQLFEAASRQGWGLAVGGRAEIRIEKRASIVIELNGRFAPLRNFSGRKEYYSDFYHSPAQVTDGKLWFYEFYDKDLNSWVRGLGIGDPPAGSETRNVSSAKVDFTGLALRAGLLFHF